MNKHKVSDKLNKLVNYLQEKIYSGEFATGSKLPPIRALMEQFDLTYGTAKRGIDQLCESGLIEKMAGNGTFVKAGSNKKAANGKYRISVFVTGVDRWEHPGIYQTVFLGLQKAAAAADCRLEVNYVLMDDINNTHLQEAGAVSDAIVLLSEYDIALGNINPGVPVVGVCMHEVSSNVSLVDLDPFAAAQLAKQYFIDNNCDKVEVFYTGAPAYRNRADIFALLWRAEGRECVMRLSTSDQLHELSPEAGLLFTTGALLELYSEANREHNGKALAEEFTVLGIDGKNHLDPSYDPAPAVTLDWQTAGRYALDECLFRIKNPGALPKRIYLPGTLVE